MQSAAIDCALLDPRDALAEQALAAHTRELRMGQPAASAYQTSTLTTSPRLFGEGFAIGVSGENPTRLEVMGELDMVSADVACAIFQKCARPGDSVVLDLSRLTFLDCSGLRSFELLVRQLAGGRLVITNASPTARRLLSLTGFDVRPNVDLPL